MCISLNYAAADKLKYTDDDDQDKNRYIGYITHISVMTIPDRKVSQATGTHDASHGGQIQQADRGDRRAARDGRHALLQIDPKDDLNGTGPHRQGRFDQSGIEFCKRTFHLP